MRYALFVAVGFAASGCLDPEEPAQSYFHRPQAPAALPDMTPGSTEAAARVDTVGRQIVAANPRLGIQPMFRTVGSPQPEVFHRGTTDVFVTEGLVKQCANDAQLTAVLCVELGKMIREREAATPDKIRARDPLPPMDARLGEDDRAGGTTDRTDLYQLQQYDKERRQRSKPLPLPDPLALARDYVTKTGYAPFEVDNVRPILQAASANTTLEKQISAPTAKGEY